MGDYIDDGDSGISDMSDDRIDEVLQDFDRWARETGNVAPNMDDLLRYIFLPEPHFVDTVGA